MFHNYFIRTRSKVTLNKYNVYNIFQIQKRIKHGTDLSKNNNSILKIWVSVKNENVYNFRP